MNVTIDPGINYIDNLAGRVGRQWPALRAGSERAVEVQQLLREQLRDIPSGDVDIVTFGSLARREWTSGSDVDWTLLVDGQAAPDHRTMAREIGNRISSIRYRGRRLQPPGAEGIFGNMAFSHDIIHHIGGESDSNRNTTQRVLLLLEASSIRPDIQIDAVSPIATVGPYERVVRAILYRYLHDDTNFSAIGTRDSRIPRFLLNDIVRYWRTMCVDFAYKEWEQAGGKWALRNIKLRMSRKLLFVSALLTVFSCYENPSLARDSLGPDDYVSAVQKHLGNFVSTTPLNIVSCVLCSLSLEAECSQLLDCYDQFLAKLDNEQVRTHLRDLDPRTVYQDAVFLELREISHDFQRLLSEVFFEADASLRDFTTTYGVF